MGYYGQNAKNSLIEFTISLHTHRSFIRGQMACMLNNASVGEIEIVFVSVLFLSQPILNCYVPYLCRNINCCALSYLIKKNNLTSSHGHINQLNALFKS